MKAQEVVNELNQAIEEHGPELEVRIGCQPSHPFEHEVYGVETCLVSTTKNEDEDEHVVYLLEGKQLDYAPDALLEQVPDWNRDI